MLSRIACAAVSAVLVAWAIARLSGCASVKHATPDPSVVVLEAQKACTLYMMGSKRDPRVDAACEAVLGLCGDDGAGGAPQ